MKLLIFHSILKNKTMDNLFSNRETELIRDLIEFSETACVTETPLAELFVSLLADGENIISRLVQSGKAVGAALESVALDDLEQLIPLIREHEFQYKNSGNPPHFVSGYCASIAAMAKATTSKELLSLLISHYRTFGSGIFGRYTAFKYDGGFFGIEETDKKATFDSLIGLEHQKKILIENTRAFTEGIRSNNVLLFGDRGTGKSSSVKALLNMFASEGLRIVEVQKPQIPIIPAMIKVLSRQPGKFIIFLDDLSFEPQDAEYKALKTAMEGQLQPLPINVLIYATSNRMHLVKENWSDREGGEIHVNDNMQETLSLSERFGISLVFSAPNQKEYLAIVAELLARKGIEMTAELEKKAIVWQMNYGSKSPRCATQFVHSLKK